MAYPHPRASLISPNPASREGDGSGLPMPRRRTFAQGILPFAHSMAAALSASCLRLPPTPALEAWAAPHGFSTRLGGVSSLRAQPGTGLPMPSRRTFAAGILPFALCMSASLRHPGCARFHSPREGHRQPRASPLPLEAGFGLPMPREPALLTSGAMDGAAKVSIE